MTSVVAKAFRVEGRVQGVGFRWWTQRRAAALGLEGSVRNLSDGAVEVQATGDHPSLRDLEAVLSRGPLPARVDRVVGIEVDAIRSCGPFRVDHGFPQ